MFKSKRKLHHGKRKRGKLVLKILLIVIAIFALIGIYGFFQVKKINASGQKVLTSARGLKDSLKNNDIDEVNKKIDEVKKEYEALKKDANGLYWMRFFPFFGAYVNDFKSGIEAGDQMIQTAEVALDAMTPYADLIGFKKDGAKFAEKSADDRIQTAVLTLDKVLVKVDAIAEHLDKAKQSIDKIDPDRYPEKIGKTFVRGRVSEAQEQFDTIASLFIDAKPLLKQLPEILGSEKEKTYLVLFENDKELRPTGGFLTAYAIFKVNKGRIQAVKSSDIYQLDDSIAAHPAAPPQILAYHKNVNKFFIRDSNLSPDFPTSVELFDSLYQKSSQKVKYDGIFAVDTHVLVDTLEILGDTEVRGITFSSKEEPKCDCPQVIYKLLDEIDRPVGYIKEDRKGILGDLMYALMQKALGFSPSQYWGPLSQELIRNMQEKHILIYLTDAEAQKAVEAINFGGTLKQYDGDYLHVNDANMAGAKSNLFVNHTITSDTQIKDGLLERTVTLEYKNPYKHSDCNLERGGLCINATLRNWVRVYVPKGSKLISFQGSETKTKSYDDLDKTVFEGFLNIKPMGKAAVTVKYTVPLAVKDKDSYKLMIQKQPGTKGHAVTVSVNGKKVESFDLISDKEITLK